MAETRRTLERERERERERGVILNGLGPKNRAAKKFLPLAKIFSFSINFLFLIFAIRPVTVFADSVCFDDYSVATHTIHFDYNTSTGETSVLDPEQVKAIANTSLIATEDGYCPNGYVPYTRDDTYIYPVIEGDSLCGTNQYRANGTCVNFPESDCPSDRYNISVVNTTLVASEDGFCANGYTPLSRNDDYIYPLISASDVAFLCASGQYPISTNGNCASYAQSTCPNDYFSYSLNANTLAQQTNGSCPSNYSLYTTMANCDISDGDPVCADIATLINLTWDTGNGVTSTTTTCTYNDTITLPATPTRPGYRFVGWVLQ